MFYELFLTLCEKKGIKPTPLLKNLKISPSISDNWKIGAYPNAETLKKLADYFDVSVDYLLGRTECASTNKINVNGSINNSGIVSNGNNNNFSQNETTTKNLGEIEKELLTICEQLPTIKKANLLMYAQNLSNKE